MESIIKATSSTALIFSHLNTGGWRRLWELAPPTRPASLMQLAWPGKCSHLPMEPKPKELLPTAPSREIPCVISSKNQVWPGIAIDTSKMQTKSPITLYRNRLVPMIPLLTPNSPLSMQETDKKKALMSKESGGLQ